jgi:hypothetical protein
MKKLFGCLALTGLLAAGCTSPDYYGAADDARYSTPSWGTSSAPADTWDAQGAPGATPPRPDTRPLGGTEHPQF